MPNFVHVTIMIIAIVKCVILWFLWLGGYEQLIIFHTENRVKMPDQPFFKGKLPQYIFF